MRPIGALRLRTSPPLPPSLTIVSAPTISGTPREGEDSWIGAGTWSSTPNLYRYKRYRDGVLVGTTTQISEGLLVTWATADVWTAPSATVEASADGGATWSAPVDAVLDFLFPSDLITPATIATPTLTRNTPSGTTPMQFTISGVDLSPSYAALLYHLGSDGVTVSEVAAVAMTNAALGSPYTIDLSGASDPAPVPSLSAMAANDNLSVRIVSADYAATDLGAVSGVASGISASICPTDGVTPMAWSATDKYQVTLSGTGNLTALGSGGSGNCAARANRPLGSGNYYWEGHVDNDNTFFGIADQNDNLTISADNGMFGGPTNVHACAYWRGGFIGYNGSSPSGYPTFATGAGVDTAWRGDLKKVWWRVSASDNGTVGSWFPTGDPVAGTGGLDMSATSGNLYPYFQAGNGGQQTTRFTSPIRTPPSGFGPP
jgi:hypothetical protein